MGKLSTMCLAKNPKILNCDICKKKYPFIYYKCIRLADEKQKQLETFAKELYCDNIDLMVIIEELEQKDQDLYNELIKFMDGEN